MKVNKTSSRDEYFDIQIKRSRQKYAYCKLSVKEVYKFKKFLNQFKLMRVLFFVWELGMVVKLIYSGMFSFKIT